MKPLLAVFFLDQHLDLALGILQNFQAALGKTDALFEDLQGLIERQITIFQFTDYRFQSGHRLFELYSTHDRVLSLTVRLHYTPS